MLTLDAVTVGPYKTGTSWLHCYFESHPDINIPYSKKETFFFDFNYDKGFSWLESNFSNPGSNGLNCEVSPSYFNSPVAANRLYKHNPDAKIIIILREPIERLVSTFLHMKCRGDLSQEVELLEAIERFPILLDTSYYFKHYKSWVKCFGEENVLVVLSENLRSNTEETVDKICNFLGIRNHSVPINLLENSINSMKKSRFPLVMPFISKVVFIMHRNNMSFIINAFKNLNFKHILFKESSLRHQDIDIEVHRKIFSILEPSINETVNNLSHIINFEPWFRSWEKIK